MALTNKPDQLQEQSNLTANEMAMNTLKLKKILWFLLVATIFELIKYTQSFPNNDHNLLLSFNQYKELIQQQSHSQMQNNQFEIGEDIEVDITSFISQSSHETHLNQDKFNYASVDCMANIVETSKNNVKHSSNLLNNDMDKSLLFNYHQKGNKYVIIELCDLIKINAVEIGNLEHFSNSFKSFKISGKKRFTNSRNKADTAAGSEKDDDDDGWIQVGEFEYTSPNSIQLFCVNETNDARPWVKYLKLEILDFYENVDDFYYTPITVFKVYGKDIFNDVEEKEREMIQNQLIKESGKKIKEEEEKVQNEFPSDEGDVDFCLIKNPFIKYDLKLASLNTSSTISNSMAVAKVDYKDNVLESILKKINFLSSYSQMQSNYMELSFNETVKIINETVSTMFKRKVNKLEKKNNLLNKQIENMQDHIRVLSYCLILLFTMVLFTFLDRYLSK